MTVIIAFVLGFALVAMVDDGVFDSGRGEQ